MLSLILPATEFGFDNYHSSFILFNHFIPVTNFVIYHLQKQTDTQTLFVSKSNQSQPYGS